MSSFTATISTSADSTFASVLETNLTGFFSFENPKKGPGASTQIFFQNEAGEKIWLYKPFRFSGKPTESTKQRLRLVKAIDQANQVLKMNGRCTLS